MEVDRADLNNCSGKSISECFDEALRTFEEISNCDLATNSSEVQVRITSTIICFKSCAVTTWCFVLTFSLKMVQVFSCNGK